MTPKFSPREILDVSRKFSRDFEFFGEKLTQWVPCSSYYLKGTFAANSLDISCNIKYSTTLPGLTL